MKALIGCEEQIEGTSNYVVGATFLPSHAPLQLVLQQFFYLILLLSREDEQLQSFLLNNPQQAVDFAQVFLKRAAENLDRNHFDVDLEKEGLAIVFAVIALQIDNLVGKE